MCIRQDYITSVNKEKNNSKDLEISFVFKEDGKVGKSLQLIKIYVHMIPIYMPLLPTPSEEGIGSTKSRAVGTNFAW